VNETGDVMKNLRTVPVLLVCLALSGCGDYSVSDRNVKETLSGKDVVGTWMLSTNTVRLLARDGFHFPTTDAPKISFAPDGRCLFQSVYAAGSKHHYLSANGRWSLEHDTEGDSSVTKKNAIHLELRSGTEASQMWLNFARENGEMVLWNTYGDPGKSEFIEYRRAMNGGAPPRR
jgi:hypothetical protein